MFTMKSSQIGTALLITFSALALIGCADGSGQPISPVIHDVSAAGAGLELKGELDTSWGNSGYQDSANAGSNITGNANLLVLPSGQSVLMNGSYNPSLHVFSADGLNIEAAIEANIPTCSALFIMCALGPATVQSDGKVLASFLSFINLQPTVIRLNTDGSLDTSFGSGGVKTLADGMMSFFPPGELVQTKDGKILALIQTFNLSTFSTSAVRMNADGTIDTAYGSNGYATVNSLMAIGGSMAVNTYTGDVYLGIPGMPMVTSGSVAHFDSAGVQDMAYGTSGLVSLPTDLTVDYGLQFDSKSNSVLAFATNATLTTPGIYIAKYNSAGQLDSGFGTNGIYNLAMGNSTNVYTTAAVEIDNNGKILVLGNMKTQGVIATSEPKDQFVLTRITTEGEIDSLFGHGFGQILSSPSVNYRMTAMSFTADNRLLLGGVKATYDISSPYSINEVDSAALIMVK